MSLNSKGVVAGVLILMVLVYLLFLTHLSARKASTWRKIVVGVFLGLVLLVCMYVMTTSTKTVESDAQNTCVSSLKPPCNAELYCQEFPLSSRCFNHCQNHGTPADTWCEGIKCDYILQEADNVADYEKIGDVCLNWCAENPDSKKCTPYTCYFQQLNPIYATYCRDYCRDKDYSDEICLPYKCDSSDEGICACMQNLTSPECVEYCHTSIPKEGEALALCQDSICLQKPDQICRRRCSANYTGCNPDAFVERKLLVIQMSTGLSVHANANKLTTSQSTASIFYFRVNTDGLLIWFFVPPDAKDSSEWSYVGVDSDFNLRVQTTFGNYFRLVATGNDSIFQVQLQSNLNTEHNFARVNTRPDSQEHGMQLLRISMYDSQETQTEWFLQTV